MSDRQMFVCSNPILDEQRIDTTFWHDFSIADVFGINAIEDTFNRAFNEWKTDYKYLTELVMVLNHKCWFWHERKDDFMNLYLKCYDKANDWAFANLKKEELSFYIGVLD